MKITVAITSFRRPAFLERAIESAYAAGFDNVVCYSAGVNAEVHTVLQAAAAKHRGFTYLEDKDDPGNNLTWIRALEMVNTPYVILLHDDDMILPEMRHKLGEIQDLLSGGHGWVSWDSWVLYEGTDKKGDNMAFGSLRAGGQPTEGARKVILSGGVPSPVLSAFHTQNALKTLRYCEEHFGSVDFFTRSKMMVGNDLMLYLRASCEYDKFYYYRAKLVGCGAHEGSETLRFLSGKNPRLAEAYKATRQYFISHPMIKPNLRLITAVIMEALDPERAVRVLNHCADVVDFGAVKLLAPRRPKTKFCGEFVQIPNFNYIGYSTMSCKTLGYFIDTDFALVMQHDGFIIHPDKWNPEWLKYDYIGAPWPPEICPHGEPRVGNSGFSLRSKRFMMACAKIPVDHNNEKDSPTSKRFTDDLSNDDVWMCHRPDVLKEMAALKMRYAPVDVAKYFASELKIPEISFDDEEVFGFHSWEPHRTKWKALIEK